MLLVNFKHYVTRNKIRCNEFQFSWIFESANLRKLQFRISQTEPTNPIDLIGFLFN